MTTKKNILIAAAVFTLSSTSVFGATSEIDCTTNSIFWANSCNQCFIESDSKKAWDNVWLLSDIWENKSNSEQVLLKEENSDKPTMVNLDESNVSWKQSPSSSEDFWEYTPELEKLKSVDDLWYVLAPSKKVTWLKSKVNATYTLTKNNVKPGGEIGLLTYPIKTHAMVNWAPSVDSKEHKECVLYKSSEASKVEVKPIAPKEVKKLPKTWPAENVLILFSFVLASIAFLRKRKQK